MHVDSLKMPGAGTDPVVVELERGAHRLETGPLPGAGKTPAGTPPLALTVTLYRDAKGAYRPKPFTLRVRAAGDKRVRSCS